MKNSELKKMIRNAYNIKPSERKKEFFKNYQRCKLNYWDMLLMQLQYMGIQLTLICSYSLAALLGALENIHAGMVKVVAGLIPVAALIALTGLGKSAKYGMEEFEMSSRFSLRMIKILRLAIIGLSSLVVTSALSCVLKKTIGCEMAISYAFVSVPYLMTCSLCMILIRHWHSPKNIYGCIVIAGCVSFAMFGGMKYVSSCSLELFRPILFLSFWLSVILAVIEFYRYIRESEELQWNLC